MSYYVPENSLVVAGIKEDSIVDGPGMRFTIFAQGCAHDCPGCQNPETHRFHKKKNHYGKLVYPSAFEMESTGQWDEDRAVPLPYSLYTVDELFSKILNAGPLIYGVTFTGGDPLYQWAPFLKLARDIKSIGLNIWCYTGFTWEEVCRNPLMPYIDVLVDGPYVEAQRTLDLPWRGSSNQRLIDVPASLEAFADEHTPPVLYEP